MSHRILFVIENLFSLGPAQQLKILADSLVAKGYEIHVAVVGQYMFEPKEWNRNGIKTYFVNGDDKTPLHTMRDGYYVVKELRQLIRKIAPQIVHSWCGSSELLTLLAAYNYPFIKPLKRIRLLSTELYLQPEKRISRQAIENKLSRRVERMIVPHRSVKAHLVENGYREERISVIPNALPSFSSVDPFEAKRDLRERLGVHEDSKIAGTVAELHHRTRLKDLIWATDLLNCIRDDFEFLIIGTGKQLRQLKRFAALTESNSRIHFVGHPESPEQMVNGLDFYWQSHLRDPVSGNLLSAMSQGIPAISVLGEGTESVIRHQETGFAVNFGARDEFARWTKYLIEQTDSAEQLAEQGQEHVIAQFDESKMVDAYIRVYDLID